MDLNTLDLDYGALRPDLITSHQQTAQGCRVVVRHPDTGQTFLFSESAFQVLQALRPGSPARQSIRAVFAEAVVQSPITARLLASADAAGLFTRRNSTEVPAGGSSAFDVAAKPRFNPLLIRIPILDPSGIVVPLRPLARVLFHPSTVRALMVALIVVLALAGWRSRDYVAALPAFASFRWWPVLYAAMAGSAALHELAHVMMADRFGVPVKQVGLLLYFLNPGAYADVSQAWLLPSRRQRIAIALAGLYAESVLWAACTALWLTLRHGHIADTALLLGTCLFTRMLVNLIPFLRLDGYWVLSDVLGMPNLRSSAFACLLAHIPVLRRFTPARKRDRLETAILLTYAVFALLCGAVAAVVMMMNLTQLFSRIMPNESIGAWLARLLTLSLLVMAGLNIAARIGILRRNNPRFSA